MLQLRGNIAHSGFRLRKLVAEFRSQLPALQSISTEYWHFVDLEGELDPTQQTVLEQLLHYGPNTPPGETNGELFIVVPRVGTISPWSTKATDIAHHCGLDKIRRIERGVAWFISTQQNSALTQAECAQIVQQIHDPMTESVLRGFASVQSIFQVFEPQPLRIVNILEQGKDALIDANQAWGMALSLDEVEYLVEQFKALDRNPTDVELMMFAQVNSEHCRHKIFNADWIIDKEPRRETLFGMIRETHKLNKVGTLVAYNDNAAVLEGSIADRLFPNPNSKVYQFSREPVHIVCKVETHNHPTGISPFPGAATGSGGEIRDEGSTGIGAKPKAGLTGFSVSNLRLPGATQPWEGEAHIPKRIAPPLQIMLEGPIGGASFNNEFGRPNIAGYFRTYEQPVDAGDGNTVMRGYHKPIMLAGGLGNIRQQHINKKDIPAGAYIVVLGGPAMMIGLGGGAASSIAAGSGDEALDFSSVQRGNAEMQRRCQEVIDRCTELGDANPILSIHDIGAGGLSNALPELIHASQKGARFQLRDVLNDDPGMTPMQIWCNESQERYALAVGEDHLGEFINLCRRERCLYCVVGRVSEDELLLLEDRYFQGHGEPFETPVHMPLSTLFGNTPTMTRNVAIQSSHISGAKFPEVDLVKALDRVLHLPAVADKTFLITIGDRSVGGLVCRDQMVGPWQVPVADVAVTASGYNAYTGEAMAIGERTPLAVVDAPASGRMAVAEALLNIAAADIQSLSEVKLSANWMAAAGHPGEDAALFDTVRSVAQDLCPQLGISIPVGKDSMSMKTVWQGEEGESLVVAPLSLIVSAFAPVVDVRNTLTPQLSPDLSDELWLVDLGQGQNRLGGSALAQVFGQTGEVVPDVDDVRSLKHGFLAIQQMLKNGWIKSYHDRSDGGLIVTLLEMSFASRVGLNIDLSGLPGTDPLSTLFSEELGAVLQVDSAYTDRVVSILKSHGLDQLTHPVATLREDHRIRINAEDKVYLDEFRPNLHRAWSETTWRMQALRDNEQCANDEYDRLLDTNDSGLHVALSYDLAHAEPPVLASTKPRVAVLREQGVNGHLEMAAAFDRAGFVAVDVPMTDLLTGAAHLADFQGLAVCGGFSFGDVLGAGGGWAKSVLFNSKIREEFARFFARNETFTLGVCNGCQMLSELKQLIPGAEHWPRFVKNRSEQFEARYVMVEIGRSPSVLLSDMQGSRLPVVVSHGEGRVEMESEAQLEKLDHLVAMRFVDNQGEVTQIYPYNPNGSPHGITGLTNTDGRVTIMMPHPERVFRTVQCSWAPKDWGEDSGWISLFRRARVFVD
ncbi:MAG: phosphoribosylformylglycinamidine synthase [Arenicellales bacterium]|nr:phosphoribosylformylglycinamidine synthase [Arenicellales bacterium]